MGASVSVLDFIHLGSTLSVRAMHAGTTAIVHTQDVYGASAKIIEYDSSNTELKFYANNAGFMAMTMTSTGGTLHGMWNMDTDGGNMGDVGLSDRRLKENIRPLFELLREATPPPKEGSAGGDHPRSPRNVLSDIIQRLRPVSYNLKGEAARHSRFGFIADEMMALLPQVTRTKTDGEQRQGIMYQDLIAVLVSGCQEMLSELAALRPRLELVENRIQQRRQWRARQQEKLRLSRWMTT